ncbi:YdaU family protein [Methylophilus flavus]|uniref:YdaU family protein n=1 Tax=Methylophilus flavus TaxID=640084 RepID=A0ABW3P6K4_9PROT
MHFYQKNIPDFNNATRHLTRVERSLFSDAIELYYDTEKPLTKDFDRLSRLLLAHTDDEKAALRDVLTEFFLLTDEGYFNKRCNEEILKYQSFMLSKSKAGKASAEQRANKKSTGVEQVLNTTTTNYNPIPNTQYPTTNTQDPRPNGSSIEPDKGIEPLLADSQSKSSQKNGTRLPDDWVLPKAWGTWALENSSLSESQIRLEAEKFKDHWLANANQRNGKKSDWLAAWRNWVRSAKPGMQTKTQQVKANNERAVDEFVGGGSNVIEGEVVND